MTWEIRKVWIVSVEMSVAYCGENEERAESVARMAEGGGRVSQAMVAVRFHPDGKTTFVEYLAECMRPDFPDPLAGAEVDITRGA